MNNNLSYSPEITNQIFELPVSETVNAELILLEYMARAIQKISLH